jgi:hypothetical protein
MAKSPERQSVTPDLEAGTIFQRHVLNHIISDVDLVQFLIETRVINGFDELLSALLVAERVCRRSASL